MPHVTYPGQHDADPFEEFHEALSSIARNRRRFRAAHRFGNIHPYPRTIQPSTRPSIPEDYGGGSDESGEGPNLDYISDMDWDSSHSNNSTCHPHAPRKPHAVYVDGNLSIPQAPRTVHELKKPGAPPSRIEELLQSLDARHDWKRIYGYWPLLMTQREVKLELAEKQLAARFNPYNELCQGVTITPVERAPSPPPNFAIYPRSRKDLLADKTTEPVMPLSLIPTERIWRNAGRLEVGYNTAGSTAPLTGSCAAATGITIHNNNDGGGPTTTTKTCGRPCHAENDNFHGGICESTEHHPGARVWICDYHDKLGRHEAAHDLRHLAESLRHYACADCCWKIEHDEADQFLDGMGWHRSPPPVGFEIMPPSSSSHNNNNSNNNPNSRHLARSITRCACASKVADRRLCAPHRLEAVAQLHRWHPSVYALETTSSASLHARKNLAAAWASASATPLDENESEDSSSSTASPDARIQPVAAVKVGASCPLCKHGVPVDHFGFRGRRGREGCTVAWVCRACLGVVTGVWASPGWVAGVRAEERWVRMGLVTRDYPMFPYAGDATEGETP
ncbi:hypothetical protein PG997_007354 [Apiospora hydei]|uniref:Uncharacterized protein n=1 Tax=Apiospora hydei TaxID=1337664 RepID=A0ABR1WAJ8_9PEZI